MGPDHLHYTKDLMEQLIIFLPLLVIMGAFMFFASRRQKRAMQATIDLHESLRVGDRVHTTSGLQATIAGITDDTVDLEIAPGAGFVVVPPGRFEETSAIVADARAALTRFDAALDQLREPQAFDRGAAEQARLDSLAAMA